MKHAIAEAARLGHGAIVLVGDAKATAPSDEAVRLEAELHTLQIDQGLDEQARSDQQHRRKSQLDRHQGVAHARANAAGAGASTGLEHFIDLHLRRAQGRHDAEEEPGQDRNPQRKQQNIGIHFDRGDGQRVRREPVVHGAHRPPGRQQPGKTSAAGERHAFDQELADDAAPRRADRCMYGLLRNVPSRKTRLAQLPCLFAEPSSGASKSGSAVLTGQRYPAPGTATGTRRPSPRRRSS